MSQKTLCIDRVYGIHTAQVGCYKSCIKYMYCFKVHTRSVHSVCSGGLGFVVSDTGQCDNCEGGAARKALHQKVEL